MKVIERFPADGALEVCTDTELKLVFDGAPAISGRGCIRVFDYDTEEQVDCIDLSIPAGPTKPRNNPAADYMRVPYEYKAGAVTNKNTLPGTPSANYEREAGNFQLTIIGGFSDGFHFYPALVDGNAVSIYLHHNLLQFDRKYYVVIDSGAVKGFEGFSEKDDWTFTTKRKISKDIKELTVSKDGGHFRTVQGALDYIPSGGETSSRYTVSIKNGDYRELVYFRCKRNLTIRGESRDGVVIHYTNNEVFNPHPELIKTNEKPGTFPSRRAAFAIDNCSGILMENLTIRNDAHGQAEGLLVNGKDNHFKNVHIIGSGDALQTNGSAVYENCVIDGEGDTVLGRGPTYFLRTVLNSYGPFMWIRNTKANHGNVFVECTFNGLDGEAVIARLPDNNGQQYPHAECVLIDCELNNIPPVGFYPIDEGALSANLLEYNSHDKTGKPVDTSLRHKCVKILTLERDGEKIEYYKNADLVLGK